MHQNPDQRSEKSHYDEFHLSYLQGWTGYQIDQISGPRISNTGATQDIRKKLGTEYDDRPNTGVQAK